MAEEVFKISVLNWEKYNERSDRGNYIWFRFQNGFFFDQSVFGLSESAQLMFVFLLCEASKRNGDEFELRMDYLSLFRKKKPAQIKKEIAELSACGLIASSGPQEMPADAGKFLPTEQTDRQTDRIEQYIDHESAYRLYPRKEGKSLGLRKCVAQIKTPEDLQALLTAIGRYKKHLREKGTEPQFVKHFSTFMTSWRDWLDPDAGKTGLSAPSRPEHTLFKAPVSTEPIAPPAEAKANARELMKTIARGGAAS